jgi:hypothetical protein
MSDSMTIDPLFGGGGSCAGRTRAAERMRIAFALMQARWGYAELPEDKVSRHTVRLGT